jgi:hypothetical protein
LSDRDTTTTHPISSAAQHLSVSTMHLLARPLFLADVSICVPFFRRFGSSTFSRSCFSLSFCLWCLSFAVSQPYAFWIHLLHFAWYSSRPSLPRTRMACCVELSLCMNWRLRTINQIGQCQTLHALYLFFSYYTLAMCHFDSSRIGSSKASFQGAHIPVCIYWHVSPCLCQNHNPPPVSVSLAVTPHYEGAKLGKRSGRLTDATYSKSRA